MLRQDFYCLALSPVSGSMARPFSMTMSWTISFSIALAVPVASAVIANETASAL